MLDARERDRARLRVRVTVMVVNFVAQNTRSSAPFVDAPMPCKTALQNGPAKYFSTHVTSHTTTMGWQIKNSAARLCIACEALNLQNYLPCTRAVT